MTIDVEALVQPIAPDAPSGEDLEYDGAFLEFERIAQRKPEQQFGDTIIPAEEPDWREVQRLALELLGRTKDVRVASRLLSALLHCSGLVGFGAGLNLLRLLLERHWDSIHPKLDPDDDNDPTMRINALVAIQDPDTVLKPLREATLARATGLGAVAFRDILIARNEIPAPAGTEPLQPAAIEAVFSGAAPDEIEASARAVHGASADLRALEDFVAQQVGTQKAPDLSPLGRVLREMDRVLSEHAERLGLSGETAGSNASDAGADEQERVGASALGGQPGAAPRLSGEVRDRADVARALDSVIRYYERVEPSSPVPILLRRAKRLVPMSFLQAVSDLAPEGLIQLQVFSGQEADSEQS